MTTTITIDTSIVCDNGGDDDDDDDDSTFILKVSLALLLAIGLVLWFFIK